MCPRNCVAIHYLRRADKLQASLFVGEFARTVGELTGIRIITTMQGCFVSICVCSYKNVSLHELSGQDNTLQLNSFRIKCALSTLRAHFYVMSFTKNDLSIISKRLCMCKTSRLSSAIRSHEIRAIQLTWIWLPFSAVMISTPDGLFKVIIACCIDCDHEMVNLHTLQKRR